MFERKDPRTQTNNVLKYLAEAYRCYELVDWRFGADAGVGGFLVDGCINSKEQCEAI